MEEKRYVFIEKAFEIPAISSTTTFVLKCYDNVKNSNRIIGGCLGIAEIGVNLVSRTIQPVAQSFSGPIALIDSLGCRILDNMKEKLPFIYESPNAVLTSTGKTVLNTSIVQTSLLGFDRVLSFTEKALMLFPTFTTDSDEEKANNSYVETAVMKGKKIYITATIPARMMTQFIRERRKNIRKLRRMAKYNQLSPDVIEKIKNRRKVSPKKRIQQPSIVGKLLALPRQVLAFIGAMAQERTILKLHEDPSIVQSPSTPGKKRQFESIESSSEADLSELDNLDNYNSEEDPDYETEDSGEVDSLEYDSGSCKDEDEPNLLVDEPNLLVDESKHSNAETKPASEDPLKVANGTPDIALGKKNPKSGNSVPKSPKQSTASTKQPPIQKSFEQKSPAPESKSKSNTPNSQKKSEPKSVGKFGDKQEPVANDKPVNFKDNKVPS